MIESTRRSAAALRRRLVGEVRRRGMASWAEKGTGGCRDGSVPAEHLEGRVPLFKFGFGARAQISPPHAIKATCFRIDCCISCRFHTTGRVFTAGQVCREVGHEGPLRAGVLVVADLLVVLFEMDLAVFRAAAVGLFAGLAIGGIDVFSRIGYF